MIVHKLFNSAIKNWVHGLLSCRCFKKCKYRQCDCHWNPSLSLVQPSFRLDFNCYLRAFVTVYRDMSITAHFPPCAFAHRSLGTKCLFGFLIDPLFRFIARRAICCPRDFFSYIHFRSDWRYILVAESVFFKYLKRYTDFIQVRV